MAGYGRALPAAAQSVRPLPNVDTISAHRSVSTRVDPEAPVAKVGFAALDTATASGDSLEQFARRS